MFNCVMKATRCFFRDLHTTQISLPTPREWDEKKTKRAQCSSRANKQLKIQMKYSIVFSFEKRVFLALVFAVDLLQ